MRGHKTHKILTAVICMCVLICMMSVTAMAGDAEEGYGYSQLTSEVQRELYVGLRDGVAKCENPISIYLSDLNLADGDLQMAADMVMADHPEYFWFNCGMSASIRSDGLVMITVAYTVDGQVVDSAEDAYDALISEVEEILDDMPESADTDYEKALYLHDALAKHVTYMFTDNDQTAYGALVEGQAVCAGYARAYQLLLKKAGVTAWTVVGDSLDPGSGNPVPHAWNLVWLDGDCCYTDVTWDDQGEMLFHEYFSRSLEAFADTHAADSDYQAMLPDCGHDAYCYFKREAQDDSGVGGIIRDDTAMGDIIDRVKVLQKDGYTYVNISVLYTGSDFSNWVYSYVDNVVDELGLNGYSWYYYYLMEECQITIVSGIGGVYAETAQGVITLDLNCQGAGLSTKESYNLMVAYYTADGQFIAAETTQVTFGTYGEGTANVECPEAFDICRVFIPEDNTYRPLTKALTLMER